MGNETLTNNNLDAVEQLRDEANFHREMYGPGTDREYFATEQADTLEAQQLQDELAKARAELGRLVSLQNEQARNYAQLETSGTLQVSWSNDFEKMQEAVDAARARVDEAQSKLDAYIERLQGPPPAA